MTVPTIPLLAGIQDLTWDQRATWGSCPICRAKHGEHCKPDGPGEHNWTHSERLDVAPARVRSEVIP